VEPPTSHKENTWQVDGAALRELMKKEGCTETALIKRAGVDRKTFQRAKSGAWLNLDSISRIAKSFKHKSVEVTELILTHESPETVANSGSSHGAAGSRAAQEADVVIEIRDDFDTWSTEKQGSFLEAIRQLLRTGHSIHVLKAWQGSVKLRVRMNADDAIELVRLLLADKLSELNVTSIEFAAPQQRLDQARIERNKLITLDEVRNTIKEAITRHTKLKADTLDDSTSIGQLPLRSSSAIFSDILARFPDGDGPIELITIETLGHLAKAILLNTRYISDLPL
jgi:hypothetical protein